MGKPIFNRYDRLRMWLKEFMEKVVMQAWRSGRACKRVFTELKELMNKKIPSRAVWVVVFYFIPILFLHECGHILACNVFGLPISNVVLFGRSIGVGHEWSTNIEINIIVRASGGLFAVLVMLPAYVYFLSDVETRMGIELLMVYQFINGIVEGFEYSWYMENRTLFSLLSFTLSVLLSKILYSRRSDSNQP